MYAVGQEERPFGQTRRDYPLGTVPFPSQIGVAGEVLGEWKKEKRVQKDTGARWTKKRGVSYYGFIRDYEVTDASVHDSRVFEGILDEGNSGEGVWADSAYRSEEIERKLRERGYRSYVNRKGSCNKPLGRWAKRANRV